MECICAIAVVGMISALLFPLLSNAIRSFRVSDSLRERATAASSANATNKTTTTKTMYVTLYIKLSDATDPSAAYPSEMRAESAFAFTESKATDSTLGVEVTYYDLKYGKEGEDPQG